MDATIKRLQNNLITLGTGSVAFGLWMLIKFFLICMLQRSDYYQTIEGFTKEQSEITFVITAMTFAVVFFIHFLIIGISARALGRGRKNGVFYLIVAFITVAYYLAIIISEIFLIISSGHNILSQSVNIVIDISAVIILFEIIVYSIRLKSLLKNCGGAHE